ncbi:hypothetical protein [Nafulsella turpanensis]|uniref:hypothetical protein n=1 Tax=Nafulsella turpanensis TaxID=1265690 RepID=UPI00034A4CDA|nr:hypothetical protein [Nafulsella turpanensis]
MKKLLSTWKESFQGVDGKLSSRKLSAFLHYVLMTVSTFVLWYKTAEGMVLLYCLLAHGGFALLLLGIVTIQHIVSLLKANKGV